MINNNAAPYSRRGAHRLNAWGALVAMVVRSAGLRGYGEDQSIGVGRSRIPDRWPMTADVCRVELGTGDAVAITSTLSGRQRLVWEANLFTGPGLSLCSRSIARRSSTVLLATRQGRRPSVF